MTKSPRPSSSVFTVKTGQWPMCRNKAGIKHGCRSTQCEDRQSRKDTLTTQTQQLPLCHVGSLHENVWPKQQTVIT